MTGDRKPSIVGVVDGDPWAPLTWSGTSPYFFGALRQRGVLAGVADAGTSRAVDRLALAAAFHPNRAKWVERVDQSRLKRTLASRMGARRAARIHPRPDALLQVGAYYDFSRTRRPEPGLRCSYHDANLAVYLRRPELIGVMDRDAAWVSRGLDWERRVYDGLDLIMVMSESLRQSFIEDFEQDPRKVVTVGVGANFESLPAPAERDWSRPRILFVGKNFELKGGPTLLRAFERVHRERPEAELWMVGPTTPAAEQPGVRWLGRIARGEPGAESELNRLYADATIFALPTNYDAFGIVFLEAMAHGLPAVGTDAWAIPEVIEDGVTGHLVPPRDPDALAERLLSLVDEPDRARALGEAGRRRFHQRFTWDRVAERIEDELASRL